MTEPRRQLRYVVGDEITARMELLHRMNLLDVSVVFEHREEPAITLVLSGVPELVRYVSPQDGQDAGLSTGEVYRKSRVLLSGEVELGHLPGEYAASRATFYTASGQEIHNDIRPNESIPSRVQVDGDAFRIVPEPNSIDWAALVLTDPVDKQPD